MTGLIKPPRLRPGDAIGVAAVSGPVDQEKLERGINRLRAMGYEVVEAPNLRARGGLFAGTDQQRASGYRLLLRDPRVHAIVFARGGYGCLRVLPHLDADEFRSNSKIHLGASDLTALFAFLDRHGPLVTFYGPMVAVEIAAEDGLDWEGVLAGEPIAGHRFGHGEILAPGRGEGRLIGGCLSLVASLAGTPEALCGNGAVLFWEDTGEAIYRIDRMLTQLERSGTFDHLQGMVIGSVIPDAREDSAKRIWEYLCDRFSRAPFPVALGLPAGHLPRPRTLPLGTRVRLDLETRLELSFLDAPVV